MKADPEDTLLKEVYPRVVLDKVGEMDREASGMRDHVTESATEMASSYECTSLSQDNEGSTLLLHNCECSEVAVSRLLVVLAMFCLKERWWSFLLEQPSNYVSNTRRRDDSRI